MTWPRLLRGFFLCPHSAVVLTVQQLRQTRDVDRDPSRLVLGQDFCLSCFGITVAGVYEGERLPVGVPDDIAAWRWVGVPGRREAAGWFCHGVYDQSASRARIIAGLSGFFTLSQSREGPDR
jgi:hypothetical protein